MVLGIGDGGLGGGTICKKPVQTAMAKTLKRPLSAQVASFYRQPGPEDHVRAHRLCLKGISNSTMPVFSRPYLFDEEEATHYVGFNKFMGDSQVFGGVNPT